MLKLELALIVAGFALTGEVTSPASDGFAAADKHLAGYPPMVRGGDLSAAMVEGIHRWADRALDAAEGKRARHWKRDLTNPEAYRSSIEPNRQRLRKILGIDLSDRPGFRPDERLGLKGSLGADAALRLESLQFSVGSIAGTRANHMFRAVRPKDPPAGICLYLEDADHPTKEGRGRSPENRQRAVEDLTARGWVVWRMQPTPRGVLPLPTGAIATNLGGREWLYRQGYELGHHLLGLEVLEVLTTVADDSPLKRSKVPVWLIGEGEGARIALLAAALEPKRFDAVTLVGGFGPGRDLWKEPIERNVWRLLDEFGDAELAAMILPGPRLAVVDDHWPEATFPTPPGPGVRAAAAPGRLTAPPADTARKEWDRLVSFFAASAPGPKSLYLRRATFFPKGGFRESLDIVSRELLPNRPIDSRTTNRQSPLVNDEWEWLPDLDGRTAWFQALLRESEKVRDAWFWRKLPPKDAASWPEQIAEYRRIFHEEVIGKLPEDAEPIALSPQLRPWRETAAWKSWEVTLEVRHDIFAWGVLLVPKDLKPGERRPVVVCQHGLEGVPEDTIATDPKHPGYPAYKGFAARLVERGFIVYAPHNPYRGRERFRLIQRKLNPLGLSLFSVIVAQHQRTLDFLEKLPFVDPARIGFYGLSYGGKTAMRVPAIETRYCLSICSADFNEWVWKNAATDSPYSYMNTFEWEMPEWNLGSTFNYAEMAALIAPRPFMVERGHDDGVAPDERVAYEYAKVRRLYAKLGIPERTEIEFFNGPHTIHGVGTFAFLHRHLNHPPPRSSKDLTP
jgi:cephalosporin-C deacetylase-like acetyl esterase/pimeloyl-ACP methyl ester carboxylesterase